MSLPKQVYVSRAEILTSSLGITKGDMRKAIESGVLKRRVFPGKKYGKYLRDDVVRVFNLE